MGAKSGGANWIRGNGEEGLPDEVFTLYGYGKRYYDHLLPSSNQDLVGLGNIFVTAFDRVDQVIQEFNASSAAGAWGDTLADFTQDFFGPDSVVIGGYITNPARERTSREIDFTLEYGLTDRMTFTLAIPYFQEVSEHNRWGWRDPFTEGADLKGFADYHLTNKENFEDFFASEHAGDLDAETAQNLQLIYDTFYTTAGYYSVLWAIDAGTDPFSNGIYGEPFNPFANGDTVPTTIDSILSFYHPDRNSSGLGDIEWGFNFLISGSPAWAGESVFSLYGGIGMVLPTARIISAFDGNHLDGSGRPEQFNELPLGNGVTRLRFSLFGEFYTEILRRLIRMNWRAETILSQSGKFWPRLSPRGLFTMDHDLILQRLGEVYRFKPGNVYSLEAIAFLELIPHRLSVAGSQRWVFKQRDRTYSDSDTWNEWMSGGSTVRPEYDTRVFLVSQKFSVIIHNIHPLKKFGPIPFELEVAVSLPLVSRYGWSNFYVSADMVLYFQFW